MGILMMAAMTLAMSRERGAPSESVDLCIIAIARRSIQSSPDPYDWSALRTRTRKGIPLAGAPCKAPARPRIASPPNPGLEIEGHDGHESRGKHPAGGAIERLRSPAGEGLGLQA